MATTPALIALAALLAAFTIPTLFRFAREIGEPADEPCSDFDERFDGSRGYGREDSW